MAIDGELLRQARESRHRSQAAIADVLGVDQTYISKLEKNKLQGGMKGDELLALARELEYDPHVFSGAVSFEDGDLRRHPRTDDLKELKESVLRLEAKVNPRRSTKDQQLCDRVLGNEPLRDLVELVQFFEAGTLRRFTDMAYAYVAGTREGAAAKSSEELGGREPVATEQASRKTAAG